MFIEQSKYENVSFNSQARVGFYLSRIDVLRSTFRPRTDSQFSRSRGFRWSPLLRRFPHPLYQPGWARMRFTCSISTGLPDITMISVHWAMFGLPLYSTVCMSVVWGCSLGELCSKGELPAWRSIIAAVAALKVTLGQAPMFRNVMD